VVTSSLQQKSKIDNPNLQAQLKEDRLETKLEGRAQRGWRERSGQGVAGGSGPTYGQRHLFLIRHRRDRRIEGE